MKGHLKKSGFFLLLLLSVHPGRTQPGTLTIDFVFEFRGHPLEDGKWYKTDAGDSLRIDRVRFYLGGAQAVTNGGGKPPTDTIGNYWLIDSQDSSSLRITLPVQAGEPITGLAFRIGVDSANQVRGARTGALDPLKGMYWTWNSGYVAVKIEGHSPAATTAGGQLEYHLGGYRPPTAVETKVELKMGKAFRMAESGNGLLTIPIDISRFFSTPFSIRNLPALMTPGSLAKQLMIRFSGCFLTPEPRKPGT